MTGGYIRRAGSKSSRVSFEIAFPPRRRHSASSVVLRCYLEDEDFEDCKESREPIKIDKHPKSQKAKEGSKVEFKCKGQGNSTELSYQWFKDGVLLPNEDAPILVLDPVRLRDFGYYVCHVSYQDFYGKDSISSRAKLVVTPGSQSGMRLKRLADVDYNIIEEICVLLQTKESVLGGWREVAAAYGLERYKIDVLGNSKEPGKSVMEFATGTRPNLTVYDFCKVLKEKPIKRLDVVNILEDHFLV